MISYQNLENNLGNNEPWNQNLGYYTFCLAGRLFKDWVAEFQNNDTTFNQQVLFKFKIDSNVAEKA